MYHSVTFGDKNSYEDWHLVPESRPVIAMPEPKTITVDIPGRDGLLDLTEAVRKIPIYQNRKGSLKFHVLNDHENWGILHQKIANYLHGRRLEVRLEDEPEWYYIGRITMSSWTSNNDGTWSDIEFGYDLDPFKLYNWTTINSGWLWDPFNFKTGFIIGERLKQIPVKSASFETINLKGIVGRKPITPNFIVVSSDGIDIRLFNKELGLDIIKRNLKSGTYSWPEVMLSEANSDNQIYVQYKKTFASGADSSLSIEYRMGSL